MVDLPDSKGKVGGAGNANQNATETPTQKAMKLVGSYAGFFGGDRLKDFTADKLDFVGLKERFSSSNNSDPEAEAARILVSCSEVQSAWLRFSHPDKQSNAAQFKFTWSVRGSLIFGVIAAFSSGLLLLGGNDKPELVSVTNFLNESETAIRFIQAFSLFVAAIGSILISGFKWNELWVTKRKSAETARTWLFERIATKGVELADRESASVFPVACAFELFRRYQFELQRDYYRVRGDKHSKSAFKIGMCIVMITALAGVVGNIENIEPWGLLIAAFLGILIPIILTALKNWQNVSKDQEKADKYDETYLQLVQLSSGLDSIRAEIDGGGVPAKKAMYKFMSDVHEIMEVEHGSWCDGKFEPHSNTVS